MSWVATAIAGSAVVGAFASNSASKRQADAAGDATRMTMEQYNQTRGDLMPWQDTGKLANTKLADYLGLTTPQSRLGGLTAPTRAQFTKAAPAPVVQQNSGGWDRGGQINTVAMPPSNLPWIGGAPATTGQSNFDQVGYDAALSDYNTKLRGASGNPAGYGTLLDNFTGQDLTSEPGYQFGISQGEQGINRMAMAGSGRNNGATMKALLKYNQDYAGTKFNDAFNRDSTNKSRTYGFLTGVSGQGENAAAQTGGLGANAAGNAGNFLTQGADASAAGTVGMANAVSGGVGNYLNYSQNQSMMDYLKTLRGGIANTGASSAFGARM